MNSRTIKAKYLKSAILIISVCFLLGAISACLPFNISVPELADNAISDTAMNITQNTSDGLGEFNNGYSYVYTDKTLVDKYRAGDANTPYDISIVEVDKTQARGTQENPFVIASVDDWTRFAKNLDDGSIASYGSGKYFVLASDLDFDGITFYPVRFFNGTFYGMGNKIKNISVDGANWFYWNGTDYATIPLSGAQCPYGYGVFCRATNATIADLIVENFSYKQMPRHSNNYSGYRGNGDTGGIVGFAFGDVNYLNCHTSGVISSDLKYPTHMGFGGLVGSDAAGAGQNMYFYRCSTEATITVTMGGMNCHIGGLLGDSSSGGNIYIYDCVANLTASTTGAMNSATASSVACFESNNKSMYLENFVYNHKSITTLRANDGGLLGYYLGVTIQTLKNCYGASTIVVNGTESALHPVGATGGTRTVDGNTISNINIVKPTDVPYCSTYVSGSGNRVTGFTEYTTSSALNSKAEEYFGANYSQIWDTSKIGGYTPDKSPVRNYLMALVNFRNLNNAGNSEENVGLPDGEPYKFGDKLPDDTSDVSAFNTYLNTKVNSNHVFLGWTDDPTGESEPLTELPSGLFGNITLYAVWTLPDTYVSSRITTSLTSDKTLIEYDSKEAITITAKADHTLTAMTNPSTTYYFLQDGKDKTTSASAKSSGVLSVKTVKDSGKYTFKYKIADGLEPLWRYDGTPSNSVDIKIEKGKLEHMTLKDFKISTSTAPYYGKELGDIDFTVKMHNKADIEVAQASARWQIEIDSVTPGTNNDKYIVIVPADTDNYESRYEFLVEFEAQALVIKFNMEQISKEIEVEVEYGQNYGSAEIIYLFQQAYLKALSTWDSATVRVVESKAPYLDGMSIVDGDANADKFDTEYNGINEIHTMQVTFKDASYEVVFNPDNGGTSSPTQETYGYGQFLKKPTPDPVNGEMLFLGWYFDEDYIA
ncbi:MAG: InlB B-repeat-containing protein, partial [Clostridia bacterium]|nr:InlB B-repeat-containing protein [Clostridia bacterium]